MEHSDSTAAIRSLAAYTGSDEEEEQEPMIQIAASVGGRLRHESLPNSLPEAPSDLSLHTKEMADDENDELPSAIPKSSTGDWKARLKVEDIEDEDESPTKEPPPPVPHYMQSPLSDSRSHTPSSREIMKPSESLSKLVSYDDEKEVTIVSEDEGSRQTQPMATDAGDEASRENSETREGAKSSKQGSEIDVDDYLEKTLEAQSASDSPIISSYHQQDKEKVILPPEPTGAVDPDVAHKIQMAFEKRRQGRDPNTEIQKHKQFRNPSIYEKLIEMLGIDQIGSNFSRSVFDPHGFKPDDYYDKLGEAQASVMERIEKDRKDVGEQKKTVSQQNLLLEDRKRRSKWDNPATSSGVGQAAKAASYLLEKKRNRMDNRN